MDIQDKTENPRGFDEVPDTGPQMNEAGEEIPTEEEQQDYDMLVARARKMMYGPSKDNILEAMGNAARPSKAMGNIAAMLLKSLMNSAKTKGREIDPNTVLEAGAEVVEDLNELGKSKGIFKYDSDEDELAEMEDAMLWGVKAFGEDMMAKGEITPALQQQAQAAAQQGMTEEMATQMKPAAAGVKQAMNPGGIIAGQMGG